jgi:hypothetical protein
MTELTITVPDGLANQLKAAGVWLPTIIELALAGFRSAAAEPASDLIGFLEKNPSPQDVLSYRASEKSHERLNRLMTLREADLLSPEELTELQELEKLEHIVVMLKSNAGKILKQ